jgi:hypothetical protein
MALRPRRPPSSGRESGWAGSACCRRACISFGFQSADSALSFAQVAGLGAAPRLAAMGLGQLLTALVQRPAIGALHIAAEGDHSFQAGLPVGARIERAALLDQLQIADCRL